MRQIGIFMDELSHNKLTIQGFNQGGQCAIGMVRLKITIEDLTSSALLHVSDVKTSYHLLLRRPWLHEAGVVPSTWHQCFKYYHNGVHKRVATEDKPFTKVEAYFAYSKFYREKETILEALPILVPS